MPPHFSFVLPVLNNPDNHTVGCASNRCDTRPFKQTVTFLCHHMFSTIVFFYDLWEEERKKLVVVVVAKVMSEFTCQQPILTGNRTSSSASLLLFLHLKLEARGEPLGALPVTSRILLGLLFLWRRIRPRGLPQPSEPAADEFLWGNASAWPAGSETRSARERQREVRPCDLSWIALTTVFFDPTYSSSLSQLGTCITHNATQQPTLWEGSIGV